MIKRYMVTGLVVATGFCIAGQVGAAELTAQEKAKGWELLFDGKTLDGWRNYKAKGVKDGWKVENGLLMHTKGGGDLITEKQYDNFVLQMEWNIAEGGNSGIFFGARETGGKIYHSAIEMQILDNDKHKDGKNEKNTSGSCYALIKPPAEAAKKAGEWNQVKVVKQDDHYQFYLNGVKTADFKLEDVEFINMITHSKFAKWPHFARYRKGHIGLQDHGDKVSFRNIKILKLD